MFVKSNTLVCLATLLCMTLPVFSQSQEEIEKIKNAINKPLLEKKPSKEEAAEAKKQFEANFKSRPSLQLLFKIEKVRNELELVDYQLKQLRDLKDRRSKVVDTTALDSSSGENLVPDTEALAKIFSEFAKRSGEIKSERDELNAQKISLLLPHQLKRLKQIATQIHISRAGAGAAMLHPSCAEVLGISDEQKELIGKRSIEISEKLAGKIEDLGKRTREQLLSELTPKQRDVFQKLKGEEFELGFEFRTRDIRKSRRSREKARPDVFRIMIEKRVMQSIELLSDQIKEFRTIQKEHSDKIMKLYSSGYSREKLKTLKSEAESQLEEMLLPHQWDRLQQIVNQIHIHRAGESAAIVHPDNAELLGISDEQRSRITSRSKELSKRLKEDIGKVKKNANDQMISLLDSKQRKLFEELVGETFEL